MQRKFGVVIALALLVAALTACTAGSEVMVPEREVMIDAQTAMDAQNLAMGGLMMGSVSLDESQFSSLLTELLKANTGENLPIDSITAWFEGGQIYLQVNVKDGVFPAAFGTTATVAGTIDASDGQLMVDLSEASAAGYKVEGAALAPINAQINSALAGFALPMSVAVEAGDGSLTLTTQ